MSGAFTRPNACFSHRRVTASIPIHSTNEHDALGPIKHVRTRNGTAAVSYSFSGFFVAPAVDLRPLVETFWPEVVCRCFKPGEYIHPTYIPRGGILGFTQPTWDTMGLGERRSKDPEPFFQSIRMRLPEISRSHTDACFAALLVDCHGGPDEARGAIVTRGTCVWEATAAGKRCGALIDKCLGSLGVRLTNGYFPPLERAAFARLGAELGDCDQRR